MRIDLNTDLGERCANSVALLQFVSSANIACGLHAGDAQTMLSSVREALRNGVAVGTHSSFPNRESSGRSAMTLPTQTVHAQTLCQTGALVAITRAEDGVTRHVKPHGMLYNQVAKDPQLADAIAKAVHACDPSLVLVGPAESELVRTGEHYGLITRQGVFAGRGYQADGSLAPRSQSNVLIEDEEQALVQMLEIVQSGRVKSQSGTWASVTAQTVCVHGDSGYALAFARHLRNVFSVCNIKIGA